ncbi:MAG: 2,3,4,5-tetrahydropyridine-2,6-dicarboxylate N-succinyltransferase, partial [Pseudomonadota bacterium]
MSDHADLEAVINDAWERRSEISPETRGDVRDAVEDALTALDRGEARVAEPAAGGNTTEWRVNEWLKKAVLLSFRLNANTIMDGGPG